MVNATIKHKNNVLTTLFKDPEQLVGLYNALTDSNLPKDTPIEIVTLENVLYSGWHNDIAFIIDNKLVILVEHQATVNPNMPLRFLVYMARTYEKLIDSKAIYKDKLVKIPKSEFIVLHNGVKPFPDEIYLKLSDAFIKAPELFVTNKFAPALELEVRVLNINDGRNTEMVKKCEELDGYVQLIGKIRAYQESGIELKDALTRAVADCIKQGILVKYLKDHSSEAINMLTQEFNIEIAKQVWREEALEEGKEKALFESAKAMLEKGLSIELIMEITKLSREQVEALM